MEQANKEGQAINPMQTIDKMVIAKNTSLRSIANAISIMEQRKRIADHYFNASDTKQKDACEEMVELYNKEIKNLLGL